MAKRYNINNYIRAKEVRLIDEKGENTGIVPINEAISKAKEAGLELVEVSPATKPPVCKILDFKKFLFDEKQKLKKSKKGGRKIKQREFRFGPYISDNDLNIRIERAKKFLKIKDRVKFTIQLKGRENAHPEIAFDKINRVLKSLEGIGKPEDSIKKMGNLISVVIMPK